MQRSSKGGDVMAKLKGSLPNKPSDLLRLALNDLSKIEKSNGYNVNMAAWHTPALAAPATKKCQVCLAGAAMAKSLKGDFDLDLTPTSYNDRTANKLFAINLFRIGNVGGAFQRMGRSYRRGRTFDRIIADYYNRKEFKKDLRKLVVDLAKNGY